jgi:hypothetical protein
LTVVFLILRRTLALRKEIAERKFAGRYDAKTILRGVFSPYRDWEKPFDDKDVLVLKKTRAHFMYVALLGLLVVFVNQQTGKYLSRELHTTRGVQASPGADSHVGHH